MTKIYSVRATKRNNEFVNKMYVAEDAIDAFKAYTQEGYTCKLVFTVCDEHMTVVDDEKAGTIGAYTLNGYKTVAVKHNW